MTPTPANDNRPAWFDDLLVAYQPLIWKRCLREQRPINVEETVQSVSLRAMEKWSQYHPSRNFATWLLFMCRDVIRESDLTLHNAEEYVGESTPPAQHHAAMLSDAMYPLSNREKQAVTMVAYGYTRLEIAKKLGVSITRANQLVKTARERMNDNRQVARADNQEVARSA